MNSCNPSRGSELPRLSPPSPTSTACACRSIRSRRSPRLHRSTASSLSNLRCPAALSERRGIINPRRGWQPCVAPYFADLGVGEMRGPPMGAPMMPPRRRWQAVIVPHDPMSHTLIHSTLHATLLWKRQPATTSGVAIWVGHHHALPACRHDPAWRNTGLRTAATPRGVAEMSAFCHRPPRTAPATKVGEIRGRGNVRLLSSSPTSTVCACRSTRSRVLIASPPHRLVPRPYLTSNLHCPAAPWAQKKCAILAGGTLLWETKLFY